MTRTGRGLPRPLALAAIALFASGCGPAEPDPPRFDVSVDSTLGPGTIFRHGPATERILTDPPSAPTVTGDSGQVSVYDGLFVPAPCSTPLRVRASRTGDTIRVRLFSTRDSTRAESCSGDPRPSEYSLLVGRFEPGEYVVHVLHEGDLARPTALDTLYHGVRILPPRSRRGS